MVKIFFVVSNGNWLEHLLQKRISSNGKIWSTTYTFRKQGQHVLWWQKSQTKYGAEAQQVIKENEEPKTLPKCQLKVKVCNLTHACQIIREQPDQTSKSKGKEKNASRNCEQYF